MVDKTIISAMRAIGPTKVLANEFGVTRHTASRWRNGETMPGADVLLRLMTKFPKIAAMVFDATKQREWLDTNEAEAKAELAALKAQIAALQTRRGNDQPPGPVNSVSRCVLGAAAEAGSVVANAAIRLGCLDEKQDRSGS